MKVIGTSLLAVALSLLTGAAARAQSREAEPNRRPLVPRLLGMPPRAFEEPDNNSPPGEAERFSTFFGEDNPHFDFRRPGDAGGLGYQRLNTNILLADNGPLTWQFNLQALMPAGLDHDGLAQGASRLAPTLSCGHELGDGSGLVGFVGKSGRATTRTLDSFNRNIHYGLALQQPLPAAVVAPQQHVFVFVEALGRYRSVDEGGATTPPPAWELLPGIHWQSSERCWLSGGLLVPFGAPRPDSGLWQFTCSWQF